MPRVHRILVGFTAVSMLLAACAPATAPSPTAAPAQPKATAATKEAEKPSAKPAASPAAKAAASPAASPAAKTAAPAAKTAASPDNISVPKPSGNLAVRWAFSSTIGFSDLPAWITAQRLQQQGWNTETVEFAQSELATEAVAKGEVQLASGATSSALTAIQQGANIQLVGDKNLNEWLLVGAADIAGCGDLNGKRLAIHSEGAVSTAMVRIWLQRSCPNANPNFLVIAGSQNRAAALMNGQIDATPLELSDWVAVDAQAPNRFRVVENFAQALPDLSTTAVYANSAWVQQNRDVAVAFLAEWLKTNRMVNANPSLLEEAARQNLEELDEQTRPLVVEAYVERVLFPPNGGLSEERVQGTIEFFTQGGQLQPGMTVDKAANLQVLNSAVDMIGRVPNAP